MLIGYYQFEVKYRDKEYNLRKIKDALSGEKIDIVVLPEFFTTGIIFHNRKEFAELAEIIPGGMTCNKLHKICQENHCYIIGSIPEKKGNELFNTVIIMGPEGLIGKQSKVHLTDYEKEYFSQGSEFNIFEIKGVKIGVLNCFESWFPEASRVLASKGVQIICHSANIANRLSFDVVRIRAIESIAYVISSNRLGTEGDEKSKTIFRGESRIIDFRGDILALAGADEELRMIEVNPENVADKSYDDCCDIFSELKFYKEFYMKI